MDHWKENHDKTKAEDTLSMKPVRTYLSQFPHTMNHEVQPADISTAKLRVRNPAGAIWRKDRTGWLIWFVWSIWFIWCEARKIPDELDKLENLSSTRH